MAETKVPPQLLHVFCLKHIFHETFALTLQELAVVAGHYARCVLPAMLEHSERVVNVGSHTFVR
jgi:hypothetical protein